jgi:hypothetical protein
VFVGLTHKPHCAACAQVATHPTPKAVNKPLHHFIVHGLDKPGSSATVSGYFQQSIPPFFETLENISMTPA